MESCDVQVLLKTHYNDPSFFVDIYNIGRGCIGKAENEGGPFIKRSKEINCWRIVDDTLQKINDKVGILFDAETYLFEWKFELVADDTTLEETLFYYWKGDNASKGFSPLPEEIENQNPIVERICQWSEPALFFHMFQISVIVFSGKQIDFKPNAAKRLFIVRGELENEIHLYEVPCRKENLRSRAIFVLIEPSQSTIYYWYGASVMSEQEQYVKRKLNLSEYQGRWTHFKNVEIREGQDDAFVKLLESDVGNYVSIKTAVNFTPRLFYFNSITGDFLATEVEYPLRSSKHTAAFPFLQSHLYTANQPALFLLDNDRELWLWQGWKTSESNLELFNIELELAKKTAIDYSKAKDRSKGCLIPIKHVIAGLEPDDFINIFPYWHKRTDITDIQIKEGDIVKITFDVNEN